MDPMTIIFLRAAQKAVLESINVVIDFGKLLLGDPETAGPRFVWWRVALILFGINAYILPILIACEQRMIVSWVWYGLMGEGLRQGYLCHRHRSR